MSDRCQTFVPLGQYDDRCATCGVPCHQHHPFGGPAPTAPRERAMSALDQQVAEAREKFRRLFHLAFLTPAARDEGMAYLDALLTTHRRQVLTEVRTRLVATDPVGLTTGPLFDWLTKEMSE